MVKVSISDFNEIIIPGTIYGYDESYIQAEVLEPGKGYWVRTFDEGSITLLEQGNRARQEQGLNDFEYSGWIETGNLKLYFGVHPQKDIELLSCSMPPIPPAGAFDVRFDTDSKIVKDFGQIEILNNEENLIISADIKIPQKLECRDLILWVV